MRKPFIGGNWKMNTDSHSSVELASGLKERLAETAGREVDVAIIPPFVYIPGVVQAVQASRIGVGGQDLYFEEKGAYTGEISAAMLKDVGCSYVLCGHSERRHVLGEDDELINKKLHAAISGGLLPILCVGEKLEQREADKTEAVVTEQLQKGLAGVSADKVEGVTIAYEPVWAIGTGKTATPDQAQQVHKMIRGLLSEMYSNEVAESIRIQYGGSVKPANAAELMAQEDIDGALVGGASLKVEDFAGIIEKAS
jgi:triosephosphate isomerase